MPRANKTTSEIENEKLRWFLRGFLISRNQTRANETEIIFVNLFSQFIIIWKGLLPQRLFSRLQSIKLFMVVGLSSLQRVFCREQQVLVWLLNKLGTTQVGALFEARLFTYTQL